MWQHRSSALGSLQQAPSTSGRAIAPLQRAPQQRGRPVARAVHSDNGKVHPAKQLKFFYFDPANPEDVREVVAKAPAAPRSSNGNGVPHSSNGYSSANGNGYHANGNSASHALTQTKDAAKDPVAVARLSLQLDEARSVIAKLQQFEVLYKESRMRSKQVQAEVTGLQQLLADKDAELARQYKRMEAEASERHGLRSQFNSALDEVKALRGELEEARQAMLELKGVIPSNVTLRRGRSSGLLDEVVAAANGHGPNGNGAAPDVLSSLQGLAKQLAEGMEAEVGSLFGAAPAGGKRDA